jgi:alpha,alpha-trehalose phosphorylase
MKHPIYPIEPWSVTETAFRMEHTYRNETVFALSNGHIGTRGTFEEGYDFPADRGLEGNFINGFYESEPIRYGEWNFGFPERSQTLLNLPNLKTTYVRLDGERFDMRQGAIRDYRRSLNLREGVLTRSLEWTSPGGRTARIESVRFVSLANRHVMAQRITVTPLNFDGEIQLESVLDADVENHTRVTNPLIDYGPFERRLLPDALSASDGLLLYRGRTTHSGLSMACGSLHRVTGADSGANCEAAGLRGSVTYTSNGAVTLDKFIAYASTVDTPEEELDGFLRRVLAEAAAEGFDALARQHREAVRRFWDSADIEIEGDDALRQGLRFNLFHILQAAGRGGYVGMGAKGLTGEGYEGHYFWDTEIYALPVFTHTFPEITRGLLDYRYRTLDAARERARVLGHPAGALYPWRTINGEECSTYVPLGTAQYHINADIAYAFTQYLEVTGDTGYLPKAAEVLCETARVWADVGCFSEARDGKYCICCVTGPDEYTAFVDNNFYTNLMARENLRDAVWALGRLEESDRGAYAALAAKIGLRPEEPELWERIAETMYLPCDEALGVYLPDDGFLLRKPWDDSQIPPEKRHLLYENYHPLFIWRQRMAKQADSILAMFLHSDRFDRDTLRRNYDFGQRFTLHHSSLSTCVFGIVAAGIGRGEEAYRYFSESARMDLDDHHGNVYAGIHAANMAGTWQAVVFGFAGVRTGGGKLALAPILPARWDAYRFRLRCHGALLEIAVRKTGCSVTLLDGEPPELTLYGETRRLKKEEPICEPIR